MKHFEKHKPEEEVKHFALLKREGLSELLDQQWYPTKHDIESRFQLRIA